VQWRFIAASTLIACSFDSTGVQSPGGSSATTTPTSNDSSGSSSSTSGDAMTTAIDDSSSSGGFDDDHCNGVPMPLLPAQAGPISEIRVIDVHFSGGSSNRRHVAPGETIVLELDYEVASCECEECQTQGMLGFTSDDWRACFYDGVPGCAGATGTAMIAVEAPQTAGFHPIAFLRAWELACNPNASGLDPANAIAGLCVVAS
jgi:hypothetical protein